MLKMNYNEYSNQYLESLFSAIALNTRINDYNSLKLLLNTSDASIFDIDYLARSGSKNITKLLEMAITTEQTKQSRTNLLANIILIKFGNNWNRLLDAFYATYDPIENYSMTEDENQNTDIQTDTDEDRNQFAFNTESADGVPIAKNGIGQHTTGKFADNHRKLTRSGNIGVTTSQMMIQSEIDLRRYNIINQIYDDIDSILTLGYYET